MKNHEPLTQTATKQDLLDFGEQLRQQLKQDLRRELRQEMRQEMQFMGREIIEEVGAMLRDVMDAMGKQFQKLQAEVAELRADVEKLKADVAELQRGQARIEYKLDHTIARVDEQGADIRLLKAGRFGA